MGYTGENLDRQTAATAGGETAIFAAQEPVNAFVVGLEEVEFDLCPLFTRDSEMVLWGRADFFSQFGVVFDEAGQRFILVLD